MLRLLWRVVGADLLAVLFAGLAGLTPAAAQQLVPPAADELARLEFAGRANPEETAQIIEQRLLTSLHRAPLPAADRVQWLRLLAVMRINAEQTDQARAVVDRIEQIKAGLIGRPLNEAQASIDCLEADLLLGTGPLARADAMLSEVNAKLDARSPPQLRVYCLHRQYQVKANLGQFDEAVRLLQEAIRVADQGVPWRRAILRSNLSHTLRRAGQTERAVQINAEAQRIARADQDWLAMAVAMATESYLQIGRNESGGELQALTQAIDYARRAGAAQHEAIGMANLADYYLRRGEFSRAVAQAEATTALARRAHASDAAQVANIHKGLALIALHRKDEGMVTIREAMDQMRRSDDLSSMRDLSGELGAYLEQAGYLQEALDAFRQARTLEREASRSEQQRAILDLQESYEAERRRHERDLLTDDNQLKTERLRQSELRFRQWALVATAGLMAMLLLLLFYLRMRSAQQALLSSHEKLKVESEQDALTGLANRRHFQVLTGQPGAAGEAQGALYLLDLDHFKRINDAHGHAGGDEVLVEVARRLKSVLREDDLVVRWGGEEFLVLVRGTAPAQVDALAQRLLSALGSEPMSLPGGTIKVTASIGFAAFPLQPQQLEVGWSLAIDLVDAAMYLAKTQGRNRACGVRRVPCQNKVELERVMLDLEAAWRQGLVGLVEIPGPAHSRSGP